MFRRQFCLLALGAVALPTLAVPRVARADDDRWEHHREHCEALEHEEHELRERRDHTQDPAEREHIDHRLHEIEEDREHNCRRD
jgi:hypothetical protein